MKKLLFALALLLTGGAASLSTASNANAAPALASISQVAEAKGDIQLVHGWKYKKNKWSYYYKPYYYYRSKWSPPYKGFCYDYPHHWWCKKYFFKSYNSKKYYYKKY